MNTGFSAAEPDLARDTVTVSVLSRAIAGLLTRGFGLVRVIGEASGVTRAASGHIYFTLKDDTAALKCVMFRPRAMLFALDLREGAKLEVAARVSVYEPRGDLQLVADAIKPAGQGDLFFAFMRLKEKLAAEGLFEAERKRPLPQFVRRVGVITSRDAAALRDVATAFERRARHVEVLFYPAAVQGEKAAGELLRAVQAASARNEVDVLIICRGGGSLEDLAAFNDETLARALASASMPTICGVGHETDFSICDFVADLRAATPTAAAELAARPRAEWLSEVAAHAAGLRLAQQRRIERLWQRLDEVARGVRHPLAQAQQHSACIHALAARLRRRHTDQLHQQSLRLMNARDRLVAAAPAVQTARLILQRLAARLDAATRQHFAMDSRRSATALARLHALDPMRVLARGYTLATAADGRPLVSSKQVAAGDKLSLQWHDGAREVIAGAQLKAIAS